MTSKPPTNPTLPPRVPTRPPSTLSVAVPGLGRRQLREDLRVDPLRIRLDGHVQRQVVQDARQLSQKTRLLCVRHGNKPRAPVKVVNNKLGKAALTRSIEGVPF